MRQIAGMLCFLGLMLSCSSQAQLARYRYDFTLDCANFVDTIAIEWERGQVLLPVEIGGRSYRFLFDTGAAQAVVYADSPVEGCRPAGLIRSQDATGAIDTVQLVTLPPVSLGHLTLTGCQATILRRPVAGRNIDGIIGFDLINRGLSAKIDVNHRLLILTDCKDFFRNEQTFSTRYKLKYHVPYIKVCPAGRFKEFTLFDTGSRSLYGISRQSFDACRAKIGAEADSLREGRSLGRHAIGHFGSERLSEVFFLHLQRLSAFDHAFCDVHTVTTQGESHLGAGLLNYGAVIFLPHKKRICFQPYNQQVKTTVSNRQQDIAFVPEGAMPSVGLIWEQGEPYRLGFRQGDIITKIDDTPILSFTQFVTYPFIIGREYLFTVKDARGFSRQIRWTRLRNR